VVDKRIDVDALLATVDIVQVIDAYVPLTKSGGEFEACCPFHSEATPSFKVSPAKQFYHCFGCGAHGSALDFLVQYRGLDFLDAAAELGAALGERSAVPPRSETPPPRSAAREKARSPWVPVVPAPADAPPPPAAHYARGRPQKVWTYRDGEGRVLGYVYRFVTSDGGKEVLPVVWARHEDTAATEWHWMTWPEPNRPLYGLDRLAAKPEAVVLLVEGEKCADAGHDELPDFAVVSWPGGGKADGKVDWSPLAGRKVVTWADADAKRVPLTPAERDAGLTKDAKPLLPLEQQPGYQTMARIRERLRSMGCALWDVRLPPLGSQPDGWDIADAVMDGLRGPELVKFLRENTRSAVPQRPAEIAEQPHGEGVSSGTEPPPRGEKRGSSGPLLIDATVWLDQAQPMEWIIDGLIQRGQLYAMTAITNHGKTAIGLLMAMAVAAGRQFAQRDILPGKVLILCGENPDGFRTRLDATLDHMGLERTDIAGRVVVLPQALPLAGCAEQILEEARAGQGDYSLVLVDTSISYYSGDDEDDNLQARTHAWHLRALAELPGRPAIIANCHPTKSADRDTLLPRGGGAFLNEIDTNLTVFAEGETAHLHWHRKKRGPDFDPIPFEFHGKTIEEHGRKVPTVVAAHITEQRALELKKARTEAENRLLFAMLRHPDSNYAEWASACGWNGDKAKSRVHRTMERLKEDKLVTKYRGSLKLTKLGEEEAKRIN
jgi:hypothetical protein